VNIGRSGRTTRPESARRENLGTLVSNPSVTGHKSGAGVGRGSLNGCVMRCAVATSPSRGPRGPSEAPFGCFQKQRWSTSFVGPGVGRPCRRAGAKIHWGRVACPTPKNWSDPASSLTICLLDMGKY